jgi:hypothetical protein
LTAQAVVGVRALLKLAEFPKAHLSPPSTRGKAGDY